MTTTQTTTNDRGARIIERRAELAKRLSAIPDDGALPVSTTRDEAAKIAENRHAVKRESLAFETAVQNFNALGTVEALMNWRDDLVTWRGELGTELLGIKSPVRDDRTRGLTTNLILSIRAIDHGGEEFNGSGWELENSRLGELMREAGYQQVGADPSRHFGGLLPWFGSLPEVEKKIADFEQRRTVALLQLDDALLDDETRAKREADSAKLRDVFNAMNVRGSHDPKVGGLVAYRDDGEVLELSDMTEIQRQAFERMDAMHRR